jgi:hypothetical protein
MYTVVRRKNGNQKGKCPDITGTAVQSAKEGERDN